jgi:hypothetical protein
MSDLVVDGCGCSDCAKGCKFAACIKEIKAEWPEPEYDWPALEAACKAYREWASCQPLPKSRRRR